MAKISPVSIKYMVYADFEAEGALDKPDVIGALFGQTEGLLGSELELRELQKEGKIGRIEVELTSQNSKTVGKIQIPSALDKAETTLIAAAIETIERIGPSNAKIKVLKVEDVRQNKRDYILERAKQLLGDIDKVSPQTREIKEQVRVDTRTSKIQEYGSEKLPCGDISGNEVIVTEGRADVLSLLRAGVTNVIAMNGSILPEAIKELSKEKSITLLLDGDRGGALIARNVIDNAKIDYIAFAPDGKEIEELTEKEVLQALRRKIPSNEFLYNLKKTERRNFSHGYEREERVERVEKVEKEEDLTAKIEEKKETLKEILDEATKSRTLILLDNNLDVIGKTSPRNLYSFAKRSRRKPCVVVINKATSGIIETAENLRIGTIIAKNFTGTGNLNLVSL